MKVTVDSTLANNIDFQLVTHDIGGLSKLDIQLAKFIHETFNELFI